MADERVITPAKIRQVGDQTLEIVWTDGHTSLYACAELRKACPCAGCIDEMTGRPILDPKQVAEDVYPAEISGVGRYGIKFMWSDGHSTGIYTFQHLRTLCPCEICTKAAEPH